eukprot:gene545-biopygen8559
MNDADAPRPAASPWGLGNAGMEEAVKVRSASVSSAIAAASVRPSRRSAHTAAPASSAKPEFAATVVNTGSHWANHIIQCALADSYHWRALDNHITGVHWTNHIIGRIIVLMRIEQTKVGGDAYCGNHGGSNEDDGGGRDGDAGGDIDTSACRNDG